MAMAVFPIAAYIISREQTDPRTHKHWKKLNARGHMWLLVTVYLCLVFDTLIYIKDKAKYCVVPNKHATKKELEDAEEACNSKMLGLWLLDIVCFICFLTWVSCCRSLNKYS
jgi:hypothetical protein